MHSSATSSDRKIHIHPDYVAATLATQARSLTRWNLSIDFRLNCCFTSLQLASLTPSQTTPAQFLKLSRRLLDYFCEQLTTRFVNSQLLFNLGGHRRSGFRNPDIRTGIRSLGKYRFAGMKAASACSCPTWRHAVLSHPSYPPRCAQAGRKRQNLSSVTSFRTESVLRPRTRHTLQAWEGAQRIHCHEHRPGSSFRSSAVSDNGAEKENVARDKDADDQILRCISLSAEVSVIAVKATEVVQEAQRRHKASPTASAALGRALVGTLLLGAMKADAETVQVTFSGEGPLGQMTTIAGREGYVKGFVGNPLCNPPLRPDGKVDVGAAVGSGILSVVRNSSHWSQPYTGTIPIYSGEVAEDIAHYLADSDQTNTAIGLGVSFTKQGTVKGAGGFLVQILPFCSEETLSQMEDNILGMTPISDSETVSPRGMVEHLLSGIGVGDYSDPVTPKFGPCGVEELKPRMMRAVASLGPSEVRQLLDEQGHVEVRCEFCAEVIRFGETDLQEVFETVT